MFIYNITLKVDDDISEHWIVWQKEVHIPAILACGFFYDHRFYRLLEQDESEGQTFVVQFFSLELKNYKEYVDKHATYFREQTFKKWGNSLIAFRTLLKSI